VTSAVAAVTTSRRARRVSTAPSSAAVPAATPLLLYPPPAPTPAGRKKARAATVDHLVTEAKKSPQFTPVIPAAATRARTDSLENDDDDDDIGDAQKGGEEEVAAEAEQEDGAYSDDVVTIQPPLRSTPRVMATMTPRVAANVPSSTESLQRSSSSVTASRRSVSVAQAGTPLVLLQRQQFVTPHVPPTAAAAAASARNGDTPYLPSPFAMTPMTPRERAAAAASVARDFARSRPILWYGALGAVIAILVFTLSFASSHLFALDASTIAAGHALKILRIRRGAYDCSSPDVPTPGLSREELFEILVGGTVESSAHDADAEASLDRLMKATQVALDNLTTRQPLIKMVGEGDDATYLVPRFMGSRMPAACHTRLLFLWAIGAIFSLAWSTLGALAVAAYKAPFSAAMAGVLLALTAAYRRSRRDERRVSRLRAHVINLLEKDPSFPWPWPMLLRQCSNDANAPSSAGRLGICADVERLWPRVRALLAQDTRVGTSENHVWLKQR
jgi:hypothetical protein